MKILTCAEVRAAEREAGKLGRTPLALMEAAGGAVARFCQEHFPCDSVCVVCGKGNNGGDGLVAATALAAAGKRVSVLLLAPSARELSDVAAQALANVPVPLLWISQESDFDAPVVQGVLRSDLIVDAVLGSGFKAPLRGLAKRAVQEINRSPAPVVAVDVPSGVDADSPHPVTAEEAVVADGVITFIAPRPAHVFAELADGPIAMDELGLAELGLGEILDDGQGRENAATARDLGMVFPPRAKEAHKGDFGHVLVLAGSLGKAGAAALAGMAALRAGAGLVTVACPRSTQVTVSGFAPELMTEGLPETVDGTLALESEAKIDRLLEGKDVLVAGPGLSGNEETAQLIRRVARSCPLPLVLDADGLNAFAGVPGELVPRGGSPVRVLTPHPGEAARLMGLKTGEIQKNRIETAQQMARETGSIVALKGWRTVVADTEGGIWINMTGNPAMAKGGSGDVLAGMIGAGLARRPGSPPEAFSSPALCPPSNSQKVAAMVYLHGLAGDLARDAHSENSMLATDLLRCLSPAYDECGQQLVRHVFYLRR